MAIEIERKFLVIDDSWKQGLQPTLFKQAYLNSDPERTVRIRIVEDSAFVTIKSKTQGISRSEFEYPIPVDEAEALLLLCETPALEKFRYRLPQGELCWEIDVFCGANKGLIVAEVELLSSTQTINKPTWLGQEVSDDVRYFNSNLTLHPYSQW